MPDQTASAKRGILYVKWGRYDPYFHNPIDATLQRSIDSLRAFHPELPIHVHTLPDDASLLDKAGLFNWTPFEETLCLDLDTVVLDRLDFGFEMACKHGLACCICECPWARRYSGIQGDLVEYNTGVQFFTRRAKPIYDAWADMVRKIDSSMHLYRDGELTVMPCNDQAAFALAIAASPVPPFILPINWNYRPHWNNSFWGPIKIWHDYRPPFQSVVDFSRKQALPDAVIQFVTREMLSGKLGT